MSNVMEHRYAFLFSFFAMSATSSPYQTHVYLACRRRSRAPLGGGREGEGFVLRSKCVSSPIRADTKTPPRTHWIKTEVSYLPLIHEYFLDVLNISTTETRLCQLTSVRNRAHESRLTTWGWGGNGAQGDTYGCLCMKHQNMVRCET